MYLSKLVLNPRIKEVRRDLSNPYEMHRSLSWAVADAISAGDERLLWRVEFQRGAHPVVLVQTRTEPRWDALLDRQPRYGIAEHKPFAPVFSSGQRLRFRLKGNPSVKRLGKRHGLATPEARVEWLDRQARGAGLLLEAAAVASEERINARKSSSTITVWAALFDGYMVVEDPEQARLAIERGIGHAKSLGLGLLSVAPASVQQVRS